MLAYGLKKKHRFTVDISLICFLITLMTNKLYLNKPRYDWDPMILGVFLVVLALAVQRWLSKSGNRHGLTNKKIPGMNTYGLDLSALGPVLTQAITSSTPTSPEQSSPTSGGKSGGGGASGSF